VSGLFGEALFKGSRLFETTPLLHDQLHRVGRRRQARSGASSPVHVLQSCNRY
jgi:hypothetical protein